MIIVFQSQVGTPTTVSDLHIPLRRYRTSIYERLHRYLYSRYARSQLISLYVYQACYRTPLRQAHISCIGFITNVIFKHKPSDMAFPHAAALLSIRCQTVYDIFVIKDEHIFNKHTLRETSRRACCWLTILIFPAYKSTHECVHRLI